MSTRHAAYCFRRLETDDEFRRRATLPGWLCGAELDEYAWRRSQETRRIVEAEA